MSREKQHASISVRTLCTTVTHSECHLWWSCHW